MAGRKRFLLEAAWVWLALAAFAVINGMFRQSILDWVFERDAARLLSTTTLAGAVAMAALLWVGTRSAPLRVKELLSVGLLWAGATALFDLALGLSGGNRSWSESLADYDPARGGFFGLVLVTELVSPLLVGLLRRAGPPLHQRAH
jgi:hypothetical protein